MNPAQLLEHFNRISEAPDAVARLRRFILDLAVRGKLVEQDPNDEPAAELLKRIQAGKTKKAASLCPITSDELLISLPPGWSLARFGEVYSLEYGNNLPAEKRSNTGEYPVYGSNGVVGSHFECFVNSPCIVVGRKGSAGALNLSLTAGCCVTDVAYYCIPPSGLEVAFSFKLFHTLGLDSLGKGVKPGLSRNEAYVLPIAIPPLAEQHRIVAKVDELMALCDQLEAAKSKREKQRDRLVAASLHHVCTALPESLPAAAHFHLDNLPRLTTRLEHIKQLRQTILNLAVRGRLVPQDPNDEPAAELLKRIQVEKARLVKEGKIPRSKASIGTSRQAFGLPSNWQAIHLDNVCNLVTSGSRGWAEYYADSGPKFVRAQNIRFGCLRLDDLACVNLPNKSEGKRTQVSEGDLLIVITGAGVTNPALMDRDLGEAYVSQHVALIKPTTADLSRWLLLCLMSGVGGRDELVERAYGAGKPGLNLDNIRTLKTPLPPLAEQHRIVAKVDELMALCDQLEAQLATSQTDSRRLLEAVLRDALV
ncbi:MAG: restriction endonuclease subunit S, partial [Desulfocapsaceae bacterium]|nr:restriction endonuclease subunit S [Desulfocapsaceae bacterium]